MRSILNVDTHLHSRLQVIVLVGILLLAVPSAHAIYVTDELEVLRIPNVGAAWQTISTQNNYISPVVVCTYNLPSDTDNEAIQRVRNVASGSFDVRIQRPENSSAVTASDVYCLVAESGLHTLGDGRQFEAHTVLSNGTNGRSRGWGVGGVNGAENVSGAIDGSYPPTSQPAVLGQVMTYNDPEFSAFWSFDCEGRRNVPFQSGISDGICVGKHVGQIAGTSGDRANETLGYIVIEQGASPNGSFGGVTYRVDLGGNSIAGVGNSPPYSYTLGASYEFAVATQEAENGGDGGWVELYGSNPLAGTALDLAIDEETVAGDTSRSHTTEQVAYWVFRGVDHGDAPTSYSDASHNVSGLLSIGTIAAGDADAELAQFSAAADADDLSQLDDEDGVLFRSPSGTGRSIYADVTVNNDTGGLVTVCGWLDVPSTGGVTPAVGPFAASDGQCQNTSAVSSTLTFQWSGMPNDQSYTTYARFRVTSASMTASDATGNFSDGEVEDYQVIFDFTPTAATIGDFGATMESVDGFLSAFSGSDGLLALLSQYDSGQAATLSSEDADAIMEALKAILDPDSDGLLAVARWDTLEEMGTVGFYLERNDPDDKGFTRVNQTLLSGLIDAPHGGQYWLADPGVNGRGTYRYRLVEQEARGTQQTYGPWEVSITESGPVQTVQSRGNNPQPDDSGFSDWKVLGRGFGARKREAQKPQFDKVVAQLDARLTSQTIEPGTSQSTAVSKVNWLYTDQPGLYRLTVDELSGITGQPANRLRRQLSRGKQKLTHMNLSTPYYFDTASDAVYFVGEAYKTLYTDENAYRLKNGRGKRMPAVEGAGPGDGAPVGEFTETLIIEEDLTYAPWIVHGDAEADYWFWDYTLSGREDHDPLEVNLAIPDPGATGQVVLRIHLQGATDIVTGADHRVLVWLNDTELGVLEWDGLAAAVLEVSVDSSVLSAGGNTLALTSEVPGPFQWLNRVEVIYPRRLTAEQGSLWIDELPTGMHTVDGFDSDAIVVIEAPGTADARWRKDITVSPAAGGGYQVGLDADQSADYLVVQADAAFTPRVVADLPSSLKRRSNQADYLIISPRELSATAAALSAYRSGRFPVVKIAWLDDIYDEFSYGRVDADAVADFLLYVHRRWRQVPDYVVLLGKGTVDHRDRLGFADSLLPVKMTTTPWGLYPSDNRYADIDGDGVAEFALGRIPVAHDSEGLAYVEKLTRFEVSLPGDWMGRAVSSADNPDKAGDFHANSNEIMSDLTVQGYTVDQAHHPVDAVRDILTDTATWESAYVNYVGHGALTQLATEGFLKSADVAALDNVGLPVFAALTCSVGNDSYPGYYSLASELVRHAGGGAVAALAPTGLSIDADAHRLNRELVAGLTAEGRSLGDAWRECQERSKETVAPFMLEIYQVTGDPAVQLP